MKTKSYVVQKFFDHAWNDLGSYDDEETATKVMEDYQRIFPKRLYRLVQRETATREKVIK